MLNQLVIVGRLTNNIVVVEKDEKKTGLMTLVVARGFKNADGIYENDFVEFHLNGVIAENTADYCKQGDIVGVKGRVESVVTEDGERIMRLVAEKVTFLSSAAKKEGEN